MMGPYEQLELLGEGSYGRVYRARDIDTGRIVAIKKIQIEEEDEGIPCTVLREVAVLKELVDPNIVSLLTVVRAKKWCLVFEHMAMDLKKELSLTKHMCPKRVKSYMHQIIDALGSCHYAGILHRDIKPQNLLVDGQGTIKLADFGLVRAFGVPLRPYTQRVCTLFYRAPELLLGEPVYATPIDMWSLGAVFYELVTHSVLFSADTEIALIYKIWQTLGTPNETSWPGVTSLRYWPTSEAAVWPAKEMAELVPGLDAQGQDLMRLMLVQNPARRISAKRAFTHPWFDK